MYIHGHYYNQQNNKITVHILTDNDRTTNIEIGTDTADIYFTDDPVEITSQVNDTFDHLLLQSATIRLLTRNFIPELFCTSCRQAIVNIYREDTCLFAGYIEPQTYSQDYNEEYDELELNCIDTLTALEYSNYREIGTLGTSYNYVKTTAKQRSFYDIITDILDTITTDLDITAGEHSDGDRHAINYYYDRSKAIDNTTDRDQILQQITINELLFLGEEEDDVWTQQEVLQEILQYLNLHILQDGYDYYIFDWQTIRNTDPIKWYRLGSVNYHTTNPTTITLNTQHAADTDTTITIDQVYNQIALTAETSAIENLIQSPLDTDALTSPYTNKQKYLTEYSWGGKDVSACLHFMFMINNPDPTTITQEGGCITDWYLQVKNNPLWTFHDTKNGGTLIQKYCNTNNQNQQLLPNQFPKQPAAAIFAIGKNEQWTADSAKDNSLVASIDMTNYLAISVNGNESDDPQKYYPNPTSLLQNSPLATYTAATSGGTFSPTDDNTTNYIVFSGKIILNPHQAQTDTYTNIINNTPATPAQAGPLHDTKPGNFYGKTVPSRNSKSGQRYYTRQYWEATTPAATPVSTNIQGLLPYTQQGPQQYQFKYSAIGDSTDHISKVAVIACMLIIGDKCLVETGTTQGTINNYQWKTYKTKDECTDDDEYYQQSFTLGIDPKIDDYLIGTEFDIQNNISHELGIEAEGTAIPIRRTDKLTGTVQFQILGPVNTIWNEVTRRHKTWFRSPTWGTNAVPLLAHTSNIYIQDFQVKIYSDNGLANNTNDDDLIYISNTDQQYINKKDNITFRINTALTTTERQQLGTTATISLSTPTNNLTDEPLLNIYDHNTQQQAKPEQLYVDQYYQEYHKPRIILTQKLNDNPTTNLISHFNLYRQPYLGKTLHVQAIERNLTESTATLTLKEI